MYNISEINRKINVCKRDVKFSWKCIISVMKVALEDVYAINIRTISNIKQIIVWIICQRKLIVILLIGRAHIPACKSITPTRIKIIEINHPCSIECYGNKTRCGCDRGKKENNSSWERFSLFIVKLKYISIYKSHLLFPTYI